MILSIFEHVHIITAWCLIDFSEINDNRNFICYFIDAPKITTFCKMEIPFAADNTH